MSGRYDAFKAGYERYFGHSNTSIDAKDKAGFENLLMTGATPAKFLGLEQFKDPLKSIAHETETLKRLSNIINGAGPKQLYSAYFDENNIVVKTPYIDNGEIVFPDKDGHVRHISKTHVNLRRELFDTLQDKIDGVMHYSIVDDELARYVLGLDEKTYEALVSKSDPANPVQSGIGMVNEMSKIDCHVAYIHSLPESLSQTQSVGKLRFIVSKFLKNINIRDLIGEDEFKKDINKGDLNPEKLPAPPPATVPV